MLAPQATFGFSSSGLSSRQRQLELPKSLLTLSVATHMDRKSSESANANNESTNIHPHQQQLQHHQQQTIAAATANGSAETEQAGVVLEKDFRLTGLLLGSGIALSAAGPLLSAVGTSLTSVGLPVAVLAGLFGMRTSNIELKCDENSFGFTGMNKSNRIVGGKNHWDYKNIVNYEFFPKGWIDEPQGPLLFYFKEVQTPPEKWELGPGAIANSPNALADGAVPGQIHWMPAMFDTKKLRREFQRRGVPHLQSDQHSQNIDESVIKSMAARIQALEAELGTNGHHDYDQQDLHNVQEELHDTIHNAIAANDLAQDELGGTSSTADQDKHLSTLHIMDYPREGACGEMRVPKKVAFLAKMFGRGGYVDGCCSLEGYTVEEGTLQGTRKRDKDKTYTIYGREARGNDIDANGSQQHLQDSAIVGEELVDDHGVDELQSTIQEAIASENESDVQPAEMAVVSVEDEEEEDNLCTLHIMDYPAQGTCGEMKVPKKIAFLAKMFGGTDYANGPCSLEGYTVEKGTLLGNNHRDKDKAYTVYGRE